MGIADLEKKTKKLKVKTDNAIKEVKNEGPHILLVWKKLKGTNKTLLV